MLDVFFIISSCTSFLVVNVMSGFVRVEPVGVVTMVPGIVMVDRGYLMDLSSARLISPFVLSLFLFYS